MLVYVLPFQQAHPEPTSLVAEISEKLAANGHAAVFGDHFDYGRVIDQVTSRCDTVLQVDGDICTDVIRWRDVSLYHWPDVPPEDLIERDYPVQTMAFRRELGRLYRQHLAKCADYSPANCLITGEMGVLVRVADKIMRLLTLAGFKVKIEAPAEFVAPKDANFESSEDSWRDLANYGVIDLLLRQGFWGR